MGDGIMISGGGSIEVATDALFDRAKRLEHVETELRAALTELLHTDRGSSSYTSLTEGPPPSAARAERSIDDAAVLLDTIADSSGCLAESLHLAAAAYGIVEHSSARISERMWEDLGWTVGMIGRGVLAPLLLGAVGAAAGLYAGYRILETVNPEGATAVHRATTTLERRLVTDPRLVQTLRHITMSADDVLAGLTGAPEPLNRTLGDI